MAYIYLEFRKDMNLNKFILIILNDQILKKANNERKLNLTKIYPFSAFKS